jgi:hypothetical protein
MDVDSIDGRVNEPSIVIASRRREVAPTTRGNLAGGIEARPCLVVAAAEAIAEEAFATAGVGTPCPYVCTNRTSFQTPSGTLTMHVVAKVSELTSSRSAPDVNALPRVSTAFAVVYVAAYSVQT